MENLLFEKDLSTLFGREDAIYNIGFEQGTRENPIQRSGLVWGQKKKVREICDLLYVKVPSAGEKKIEPETVLSHQTDESDVMGSTRFVYLDENAGKTVAP